MEPYIGEIRMFTGDFAPVGWFLCDGRSVSKTEYPQLSALIGTTYGKADGKNLFKLPDLRGRIPMHAEVEGSSLSGGYEKVHLMPIQMPVHSHLFRVSTDTATGADPDKNLLALPVDSTGAVVKLYSLASLPQVSNNMMLMTAGKGEAHENMPPFFVVNFIIAYEGIFIT